MRPLRGRCIVPAIPRVARRLVPLARATHGYSIDRSAVASAVGAKEPEPTAQVVGILERPNRAAEGRWSLAYREAVRTTATAERSVRDEAAQSATAERSIE